MRCFFGIPVTGVIHTAAEQLVDAYRNHPAMNGIRWTPTTNWHLTIRFLGQTTDEQRAQLIEQAQSIAQETDAFDITANGILILPQRRPRVLCLSVRLNDSLAELFRALHKASLSVGFEPEKRPFLPHITVGRWHSAPQIEINKVPLNEVSDTVDRFHLYESATGEDGSVYTLIETFEF